MNTNTRIIQQSVLWLLLAAVGATAAPAGKPFSGSRDVTFLATSDCHYDAFENEDRNVRDHETVMYINGVTNVEWSRNIGGGMVKKPRGMMILGDAIDDGDRMMNGKNQSKPQYEALVADMGLDGTDGKLKFPVFEAWGNHDGPPEGKEKNGFSYQAQIKKRNQIRLKKGLISNLSSNFMHSSWDWDDVHFVQLGIYPADQQRAAVKYSREWHNPQGALSFLKADLAKNVGTSGRPVVLMSHCGFDTDWWHKDDWKDLYDAAKQYNIVLYLYGHTGTGIGEWAPPGETKRWNTINTGQTENGFFVVQITANELRCAYRLKKRVMERTAEGKPEGKASWQGEWEWKYTKKTNLQ